MFNILRRPRPGIAEIQCSRIVFEPGDRVLVRVYHRLDEYQRNRLRRSINKWAGVEVEVLIVDATEMEVTVEKHTQ